MRVPGLHGPRPSSADPIIQENFIELAISLVKSHSSWSITLLRPRHGHLTPPSTSFSLSHLSPTSRSSQQIGLATRSVITGHKEQETIRNTKRYQGDGGERCAERGFSRRIGVK